jgi:hypothetical protein
MNRFARAAQIWSILALAAHNRQVLTYEMIHQLTGLPRHGLKPYLDPIQDYCLANRLPALTVLVVSHITGVPRRGFRASRDIPQAQQQVFLYDWLDRGSPSPADFQRATNAMPATPSADNGRAQ